MFTIRWFCVVKNFYIWRISRKSFTDRFSELLDDSLYGGDGSQMKYLWWYSCQLAFYINGTSCVLNGTWRLRTRLLLGWWQLQSLKLWKTLRITFLRSLLVCFLLILQSSFTLASRYILNVSLSIIRYAKMKYNTHELPRFSSFKTFQGCTVNMTKIDRRNIHFLFFYVSSFRNDKDFQ